MEETQWRIFGGGLRRCLVRKGISAVAGDGSVYCNEWESKIGANGVCVQEALKCHVQLWGTKGFCQAHGPSTYPRRYSADQVMARSLSPDSRGI